MGDRFPSFDLDSSILVAFAVFASYNSLGDTIFVLNINTLTPIYDVYAYIVFYKVVIMPDGGILKH